MSARSNAGVAAFAGAIGGGAAGLIDLLVTVRATSQYVPGLGGKLWAAVYAAFSSALLGLVLAVLVSVGLELLRTLSRGPIWLSALRGRSPERPPLAAWSYALCAPIMVAASLPVVARLITPFLNGRRHLGLAITMAVAAGLLAVVTTSLASLVVARALEWLANKWPLLRQSKLVDARGSLLSFAVVGASASAVLYFMLRPAANSAAIGGGIVIGIAAASLFLFIACALVVRRLLAGGESATSLCLSTVAGAAVLGFALGKAATIHGPPATPALLGIATFAALPVFLAAALVSGVVALALNGKIATNKRAVVARLSPIVALALFALVTWLVGRSTFALIPLRPAFALVLLVSLCYASLPAARLLFARVAKASTWAQRAFTIALPSLLLIGTIGSAENEAARYAVHQYTGLSAHTAGLLRRIADFDRDGYSAILGGGDCDDWDRSIRPGASDVPDDGIDQNCVGGDTKSSRGLGEVAFAPIPSSIPKDFNVVLITIDTVRSDHFGSYGYKRATTPNMDALARDGAVFENGWAHAPSTRYSMPAILTGRYPLAVEYDYSIRGWPGLSLANTTIAEILKAHDFKNGAILNYWYFDRMRRMNQGFDHYDNQNRRLHAGVPGKGPAQTAGSSSREQSDKAIQFVAKNQERRFFLWVHYYDPHFQYEKHPEVEDFGDSEIDRYDNEIAYTDLHIGRLIDDIKARGLYDKTVFVITGDHGEGFGEHNIDLHGYHLYAAQTRVPFIVRVPGLAARRIRTPASHVDILPTLANLAGSEASAEMMGRSLVDLLSGADEIPGRTIFQQLSYEGNHEHRGAANAACHVLYDVSPDTRWHSYRIDRDPNETRDVTGSPGPCKAAREALEAWYDSSELPLGSAEALLEKEPTLGRRLDLRFGDNLSLIGAELNPGLVRRGGQFELSLTYKAERALSDDWRVFVHVEGPAGSRFIGDHKPVRPFSWWRKGQFIRYSKTIHVPRNTRAGQYKVYLGLFRGNQRKAATSSKLPVVDNRAEVATLRVQ